MEIDYLNYQLSSQLHGHEDDVRRICVCGNTGIATSSRDKSVRFWSIDSANRYRRLDSKIMVGHTSFVGPLAWIPPNQEFPEGGIVSGGMDTLVCVWDLKTGRRVHVLRGHAVQVTGIALDDADIVSCSVDGTLKRWRNGELVKSWKAHSSAVQAVIKLPSGELVTGSSDSTLRFWKGKKCLKTFDGHVDTVRGLASMSYLDPDDDTVKSGVLSASHDCSLRLWGSRGLAVNKMFGHTSLVYSVDSHSSVDSRSSGLVASGSEDCLAKIWRGVDCVQSIEHPGCVWDVKFLENGDLVTACSDGVVRIWTCHQDRIAESTERELYLSQLYKYKICRKGVGGLNLEELPGLHAPTVAGASHGQIKFVREEDNVVAYSWNMSTRTWDKIGEFVDGPGNGTKRHVHDGREFDGGQFDEILPKLVEFDGFLRSHQDLRRLLLTEMEFERLVAIVKILNDTSAYHTSRFADDDFALLFRLLDFWPSVMLFPVFYILPKIILHPDGAAKLLKHINIDDDHDAVLLKMIRRVRTMPESSACILDVFRVVNNLFNNSCFYPWLHNHRTEILDEFSGSYTFFCEHILLAYSTLILNYSVLLFEKQEEVQSQALSAALEAESHVADSGCQAHGYLKRKALNIEFPEPKRKSVKSTIDTVQATAVEKEAFTDELKQKIIHQVHCYLSDKNLLDKTNEFLKTKISEPGGLELVELCKLATMRYYLGLPKKGHVPQEKVVAVGDALRASDFVTISDDGMKVRRRTPVATVQEFDARTVAASPLPLPVILEQLKTFFSQFGEVNSVTLFKHDPSTALVEFSNEEVAQEVLKRAVDYMDVRLELETKKQFDEKRKDSEGKEKIETAMEPTSKATRRKFHRAFDRPFLALPRKEVRPENPWMELLQIPKYRNPPKTQLISLPIENDAPVFGIRWTIPEVHYLMKGRPQNCLPPDECCRLKLHFMSLVKGHRPRSKRLNYQVLETRYLRDPLFEEYPSLDEPDDPDNFHKDRFGKHLENQNVLDQREAAELMLSCHMTFQMADLLIDMRYRACEYADREGCFLLSPEHGQAMFQMQAMDVWRLVRDLLGPQYEPILHVTDVEGKLRLYEISLWVDERMQSVTCNGKPYIGIDDSDIICF